MTTPCGRVYLIHLDDPLHANRGGRHYIGWSGMEELVDRLERHRAGRGAAMLAEAHRRGIEWRVVRVWDGDRAMERRLKRRHQHARLCPLCRAGSLARHAARERRDRRRRRRRAAASAAGVV